MTLLNLKTKQIEEIYNQEKEDFLKTALTINKTDLETAVGMAENSNEAVIDEIINPGPGVIRLHIMDSNSVKQIKKLFSETFNDH